MLRRLPEEEGQRHGRQLAHHKVHLDAKNQNEIVDRFSFCSRFIITALFLFYFDRKTDEMEVCH